MDEGVGAKASSDAKFAGWSAAGVFLLAGLAIGAGGLALAPLLGLGGILGLAALRPARLFFPPHPAVLCAMAFALWAGLSLAWSPYGKVDNAVKLILGGGLYTGFLISCARFAEPQRALARAGLMYGVMGGAVVLLGEWISGGAITRAHRELGVDPEIIERNLAHGASALVAVAPAMIALSWRSSSAGGWAAGFVAIVAIITALGFGSSANVLGVLGAALGLIVAVRWPRRAVLCAGAAASASVVFAPLVAPFTRLAPFSVEAGLPASWEHRVKVWSYIWDQLWRAPFLGHGFDASRTVSETVLVNGEVLPVLPLHPHNLGLQVWFETGLVGVAFLSAAFVLGAWRIAHAPRLSRRQAVGAAGCIGAYAGMSLVSYGAWQEWWVAAAFFAAAGCLVTGQERRG